MRLTSIINLPVVFLALVLGAAAAPVINFPLVNSGPSHFLFFKKKSAAPF
jgi:hypothetical protein